MQVKEEFVWPKASPQQWYLKFDSFIAKQCYHRCHSDHYVYFKSLDNGSYIILLVYVDDMLVARSNM